MAGTVYENAVVYKNQRYKYTPPAAPSELIECTSYVIDFANRKFINIGLDPKDDFNIMVIIIAPSRHITMSHTFLTRIYSLMGYILSFILEPQNVTRMTFLETDTIKLSSMKYREENVLVIESKIYSGCRVLLNRTDLISLQELEHCLYESAVEKLTVMRPTVLQQFDEICNRAATEITVNNLPKYTYEMKSFVRNLNKENVFKIEPGTINFQRQIKLLACEQIVERLRTDRVSELKAINESEHGSHLSMSELGEKARRIKMLSPPLDAFDENANCSRSLQSPPSSIDYTEIFNKSIRPRESDYASKDISMGYDECGIYVNPTPPPEDAENATSWRFNPPQYPRSY